jgi:hypothetical protein
LQDGKLLILQNGKPINLASMSPKEFDALICQFFDFPDRETWPLYQRAEFLDQIIKKLEVYEDTTP